MTADHLRDIAMGSLILGFFASAWFGWAQENPPAHWRGRLGAGSAASLLVALTGGIVAWRNWDASSALDQSGTLTRFIVVFWIEVAMIAIGGGILAWKKQAQWIAPWAAFVVGIHFLPLGPIFDDATYIVLGMVLTVVAIATFLLARQSSITPSAVTGATAGTLLLTFALWNLVRAVVFQ